MRSTTLPGTRRIRNCSARRVGKTAGSCFGMLDVRTVLFSGPVCRAHSAHRKPLPSASVSQTVSFGDELFTRWKNDGVHLCWASDVFPRVWTSIRWEGYLERQRQRNCTLSRGAFTRSYLPWVDFGLESNVQPYRRRDSADSPFGTYLEGPGLPLAYC